MASSHAFLPALYIEKLYYKAIHKILFLHGLSNTPNRDSLTDMSLLMYSCKAGASGVGNVGSSVKIVNYLVELGCDLQVLGYFSNILKQDFEHI